MNFLMLSKLEILHFRWVHFVCRGVSESAIPLQASWKPSKEDLRRILTTQSTELLYQSIETIQFAGKNSLYRYRKYGHPNYQWNRILSKLFIRLQQSFLPHALSSEHICSRPLPAEDFWSICGAHCTHRSNQFDM